MIYLQLFWSFFQIGLFTIGGGYASLPLIRNEIVVNQGWLTMQEYTDIITISQITPGPIAINSATFVGHKSGRFGGSCHRDAWYGHAFDHPLVDFGMGLLQVPRHQNHAGDPRRSPTGSRCFDRCGRTGALCGCLIPIRRDSNRRNHHQFPCGGNLPCGTVCAPGYENRFDLADTRIGGREHPLPFNQLTGCIMKR